MQVAPSAPVFVVPEPLPRGPHRLSRAEVSDSQRTRLLAAIADVVAERGYAGATINEISARAGVSPKTFYEHFADKLACYLAGYDRMVEVLYERMGYELPPTTDWHEFIVTALAAYLETLEANPAVARAFVLEIEGAGPEARERRRAAYRGFADLIRRRHELIRKSDPSLAPLPPRVYMAIVHGVRELVRDALAAEERPKLTALGPDVFLWLTATVRGAAAAARELAETPEARRLTAS